MNYLRPVLLAVMFGIAIWWAGYKYGDCRKVGHSVLYCVMDIGS